MWKSLTADDNIFFKADLLLSVLSLKDISNTNGFLRREVGFELPLLDQKRHYISIAQISNQ